MLRRPFFLATVFAALLSTAAGLAAGAPRPVPAYALQAASVYRAEVGLALFAALHLVGVCLRLAWHGQTFTRIGSTLEVPEVGKDFEHQLVALAAHCEEHDRRLRHLEGRRGDHPFSR